MRYVLKAWLLLAWGIWLGALVGLFIAVQAIFLAYPADAGGRRAAGHAASAAFIACEHVELFVAAAAVIGAAVLRLMRAATARTALFCLLAIAAIGTAASAAAITPRIEQLRVAGETRTPQFVKLHAISGIVYVARGGLLAIAGLLLPAAIRES